MDSDGNVDVIKCIFQDTVDAVCLISRDFRILWANKTFLAQTGYELERVKGEFCYKVTHNLGSPCQPPDDPCPIHELEKTGKPVTYNHRHFDSEGKTVFVEVIAYPVKDNEGEIVQYVHQARDVTEHMNADEMLRSSAERLHSIIENYSDGIIIVDKNGTVRYVNPAVEALFGRKSDEFSGENFEFPIEAGESVEINIEREDGERLVAVMRVVEMEWEGENTYLVSIHDITELKRVEQLRGEVRKRDELNKLKDEFISNASHELRTPLTSIKNAVDIVLKRKSGELNDDQRKFLSIAERNINKLKVLIEDLLNLSRIESGRLMLKCDEVHVRPLIENVIEMLSPLIDEKFISLKTDNLDNVPPMYVDESRIEEVLINLVSNAIKFSPENSVITINADSLEKMNSAIGSKESFIEISVEDDGIGIPDSSLDHIFENFYQVETSMSTQKVSGTGLGLAICKGMIEAHGGKISCRSKEGEGSTFSFTVPKACNVED